jgi:hypothetical protein
MIVLISRGLMAVASMRELLAGCASDLSCHHPRKRVIQYAAASRLIASASGILGRPVKPGDDTVGGANAALSKRPLCGTRHCLAPMVIVSPSRRVNRILRTLENARETGVSAIPSRWRPARVYIPFIAILKLPFKFDRS